MLIPLLVLIIYPKQPSLLKPVIVYLWLALVLNLIADIITDFKVLLNFPGWLRSNNPIYNIHSMVRYSCFTYFFFTLKQPYLKIARKVLAVVSAILIVIQFSFFEDFFYPGNLNGNLLSGEAFFLLVYCMLYYLSELRVEDNKIIRGADFWVVTGLCVYVVINFFVFLFYVPMIQQNLVLAIRIWNVHNIAYILFCLFIAKAFYATSRTQY